MMAGVNCGLRPMRDVALLSCITQITSVLHIAAVLGPNGSNTKVNYIITGTFATMWGIVAGYSKAEMAQNSEHDFLQVDVLSI